MRLIPDDKELQVVKRAQDLEYMRLLRVSLRIVGSWPGRCLGEKESKYILVYRWSLSILFICTWILGMMYLKNNINKLSFFELGHSYITVFMNMINLSRSALNLTEKHHKVSAEFTNKINLFNHKEQSEYARKTKLLVHKLSHVFTIYVHLMMLMGLTLFNIIPLYNNYMAGAFRRHRPENITFEQAVYYELPFDYKHNFRGFLILFTCNFFITCLCSCNFCIIDLLLSLMIFNLWGHIKILIHNLENFPRPKVDTGTSTSPGLFAEMYSQVELKDVHKRLADIANHHRLITRFAADVSHAYGFSIALYYLFHQVSGCLLLLECSQMEPVALMRYGPLTLILFSQLIQISVVFELLASMTESLIKAAYSVPWECMDASNRRIVVIILSQCQLPLGIKAMGMVDVGLQTMLSILKTTVSYFVMLQTIAQE